MRESMAKSPVSSNPAPPASQSGSIILCTREHQKSRFPAQNRRFRLSKVPTFSLLYRGAGPSALVSLMPKWAVPFQKRSVFAVIRRGGLKLCGQRNPALILSVPFENEKSRISGAKCANNYRMFLVR